VPGALGGVHHQHVLHHGSSRGRAISALSWGSRSRRRALDIPGMARRRFQEATSRGNNRGLRRVVLRLGAGGRKPAVETPMQMALEEKGDVLVIRVQEVKLTYPQLSEFFTAVSDLVGDGVRKIVLDLEAVTYIDSSTIG